MRLFKLTEDNVENIYSINYSIQDDLTVLL